MSETISYEREIPEIFKLLGQVHEGLCGGAVPRPLLHLIQLRASQINGCGFCVKMHTREAREDGESSERLDRLIVWDQVGDFTGAERAALAWTEALTRMERGTDYAALREGLRAHFAETQIAEIGAAVAMINLWNRFQISRH